ncbi:MAG: sigma-54 dependent transcriptional regulator [Bacteroidetes bacterium]|nr:sigma-54 dependent transcriptional regulator [Bacteroidota bacterium]
MDNKTILLVDDDTELCGTLSQILRDEGYNVISSGDSLQAINILKQTHPDLILLDSHISGNNGTELIKEMKKIDQDVIIIMTATSGSIEEVVRIIKLGAYDYLIKPFRDFKRLILLIKKALQTLNEKVNFIQIGFNKKDIKIIGKSILINDVFEQIQAIAKTNITVVLQGESGTGKELVAREIHRTSKYKNKPFVTIDCGAIPDTLFESEFFGYDKGAFTGADNCKLGKFEIKNGGTIFLDEINNLTTVAQGKFLRAIEERKIQHLGGRADIDVDVRIIVATNTNLFDEVKKGNFRHDLYYRLNEFVIDVPPLRARKDDISLLTQYFLEQANVELGKNIKGVFSDAEKLIMDYDWPGNIRELRNVIRRAVILTESDFIMKEHLPSEIAYNSHLPTRQPTLEQQGGLVQISKTQNNNCRLHEILENGSTLFEMNDIIVKEFEQEAIMEALKRAKNNKTIAAKLLKIDRKTLYSKLMNMNSDTIV